MNVQFLSHRLAARALAYLLLIAASVVSLHASADSIAAGRFHGLMVRDDGTVAAWGYNLFGQIGDGSYIDRSFPVAVPGFNGVKSALGGGVHSLALKVDGTVWGWGDNSRGQLGDGTTIRRVLPVKVSNLTGVIAIAAGFYHSLALKSDGTVWTWGANESGELGDGTTTGRLLPVQVPGLTNIKAIAGGYAHSVALRGDKTVWAWGINSYGQIGDGTSDPQRLLPVQVKGLANIERISTNADHSLALQSDNTVWAWGYNYYGQIGNGTDQNYYTVAGRVPGVNSAVEISAGTEASYARLTNGTIIAWGNNDFGQIGDGSTTSRKSPVTMPNGSSAAQIAAGASHFTFLRSDGTLWSVGQNVIGQLGDGNLVQIPAPVAIPSVTNIAKLAPGYRHTLAVRTDGTVAAWGDNASGQLGDNTTVSRGAPTTVAGLSSMVGVASGVDHSVALRSDGTIWTWGKNDYGQLGSTTVSSALTPLQVPGLTGVVAITSGFYHVVALKSDGSLWAWGRNTEGQVGDGTITNRFAPTRVLTGNCIGCPISAGGYRTLLLRSDGTVAGWGGNASGELGDGTQFNRPVPVTVAGLNGVTAIAAGHWHSLALMSNGTISAWGYNGYGALGTNTYDSATTFTQVIGATGVTSIAAGGLHSMALTSDGAVLAWGNGGIVGDGTDRDAIVPTTLSFIGPVDKIAVGRDYTLAVTRSGTVMGWGSNYSQKIGIAFPVQNASLVKTRDPLARVANSDLVVEFFNPAIKNGAGTSGIGHYFITANPIEAVSIDNGLSGPGWQRTGRSFRAWLPGPGGTRPTNAPQNAVPVYRFYGAEPNSHFYTPFQAEYQSLRDRNPSNTRGPEWAFESIEFYTVVPDPSGVCPAGYQKVYRAYNNRFGPPAQNDGNHRLTPSAIDYLRAISFLGYTGEGVAFCSPTTTDPGADLQAWYIYPGAEVQSGSQVYVLFVFTNNGPGDGNTSRIYMALPPEISNWTMCVNSFDLNCVGVPIDPLVFRSGQQVTPWPAGVVYSFLAKGTAPQVTAGGNATLKFGAFAAVASGAPDVNRNNNAPSNARTLVKTAQTCSYALNPTSLALGTAAQDTQFGVLTSPGCPWSVQNTLPWLAVSPASGSGTSPIVLRPQANTVATARSGTITVNGQTLTVSQAGLACTYTANPPSLTLTANAQNAQIALASATGCNWTAQGSAPWFAVLPGTGTSSATLTLSIAANATSASRTGSITVGGLSIPIVQSGVVEQAVTPPPPPNPCATFRLQRDGDQMPADGISGDSSVAVFADSVCGWNSQSTAPWLTITNGAAGTGNGTLKYVVQPNLDQELRIGNISTGGRTFTVTQQGRAITTRDTGSDGGGDSSGGGGGGSSGGGGGSSGGSSG